MARARERSRGRAWSMIRHHYVSRAAFSDIYKAYEVRVLTLVRERGVPRDEIKLTAPETEQLFDTGPLKDLLLQEVQPLRDTAHAHFRHQGTPDPYDSDVSRIYHELSILKEEHLSVRDWPKEGGAREFARLFREVSEYYPQRLRRIKDLFARATRRLETLLPDWQDDTIVLRSVFLFRDELWPESPRPGLVRFLGKMFPGESAGSSFLLIARSFFKAGFFEECGECARMGVAITHKSRARTRQVRDEVSELDRLAARADAERQALVELDA